MSPATIPATTRAELFRALGTLTEPPAPEHGAVARALGLSDLPTPAEHAELFLFAAYPYASVYLGAEGMLGGEARDRVAGFWRALDLTPPAEPDHLAILLAMYATLIEADARAAAGPDAARAALRRESRFAFLWEHLLSWLPVWLDRVEVLAPPAYVAWSRLLRTALVDEAAASGPPSSLPLALRTAPGMPGDDDDDDLSAWVAALLAPVRCGIVLTRPDLRRAARDLGLGSRPGERAFMLRSLLEQDPDATVGWLAEEARRASARYHMGATLEPVARFWRQRADGCRAALLRALVDHGKVVRNGS